MLEFLLHTDKYLADLIVQYGPWIYALLFAIVFCETGLVVTPFLPGDSLLFAAGALAATTGQMSIPLLWVLLAFAAILGDAVNYSIGRRLGTRVFSEDARILKTAYLRRTEAFYEKHGNRTIILARFVPIVRTFAPFVAGVGSMQYRRFATYNVVGGLAWVTIFLGAGALFGQIEFVKKNFEVVTLGIVLVSVLPIVFEFVKEKRRPTADPK
ncbi:MAG: DedA family protein [Chloroflexi bacterium]|nr:DedA family protein [Chloroflexota bacterium]